MPERIRAYDCCGVTASSTSCPSCGGPGEFAGWGLTVPEAKERYRRVYGLEPLGPHVELAERAFAGLRSVCHRCDGAGVIGDVYAWRECPVCEGGGGAWAAPELRIRAAYLSVLRRFPGATTGTPPHTVLAVLPAVRGTLPTADISAEPGCHGKGTSQMGDDFEVRLQTLVRSTCDVADIDLDYDDWVFDVMERFADPIFNLYWNSDTPTAGAGSEHVYILSGKYITSSTEFGWGGPYDSLDEIYQIIPINGATREIWCAEWSEEEMLDRLELDDPFQGVTLNGTFYSFERLEFEGERRRGRADDATA
jgi:hypothetical protein